MTNTGHQPTTDPMNAPALHSPPSRRDVDSPIKAQGGQSLLERESELKEIATSLRRAQSGQGALVVIRGPIGCGKSSVLQALPALADGARVLRASSSPLEQDYAFGVVRQLIDPILSTAEAETRERWLSGVAGLSRLVFADDAPPMPGPSSAPIRESVLLGLTTLIGNISAEIPLLILVDDAHWLDVPSLCLLNQLARHAHRMRVLVVAAMRDGDIRANPLLLSEMTTLAARELRPAPLSIAATRLFIEGTLGMKADDEFIAACYEASDGNPMILGSVTHNVTYHGLLPHTGNAPWVRSLRPGQLRDRLAQCIKTQAPAVQTFARALAVLGEHAELDLVGRLAELDLVGCDQATGTMYELGLLKDKHRLEFSHLVVKDAIDATMTMAERERLHLAAVHLLNRTGHPAEQVAAQLLAITSGHDAWAVGVLRVAADTAVRRGAPEVASRYLRRALLDAPPDSETRAQLLVDLATNERGYDPAAAVRHISYAAPLLKTARARAAALVRISPAMLVHDPLPVRGLIAEVAAELGDPDILTGINRDLALRLETRLRHSANDDPGELADAVRRLKGLGPDPAMDTAAERELLTVLLHAAVISTRVPAAEVAALATRLLDREAAAPSHVHTAFPLVVVILAAVDKLDPLVSWLEIAQAKAAQQDVGIEQTLIRAEQALTSIFLGRPAEARAAALDVAAFEWSATNATASAALSVVALELRDQELTELVLRWQPDRTRDLCLDTTTRMLRASTAETSADLRQALEDVLECGRQLDRSGWINPVLFPWQTAAAQLHKKLGDTESALRLADEALKRARDWGVPSAIGRALRILALLSAPEQGAELLREAITELEASANVLEQARARLQLGIRLHADGDAAGDELLNQAHRLALKYGIPDIAAKAVKQLGIAHRSTKPGCTLTRSETRVVKLVLANHTNQEISEILQVSCRAIEKHLTNSFRKLGVRRRTELADVMIG